MQQKPAGRRARICKIKLTTPFEKLTERNRNILVNGGDGFAGIVALLQDTFERASGDYREWLTRIHVADPLRGCKGKRLRASSLSVRVKGLSIAEVVEMPIARALLTVRGWELADREKQIAGARGG